ncbi:hypothetical protein [Varunaivibrio sulfuroxidans]|nr:hypothetical protein [Varunaivibrio sulfuroxidans]WES29781.1 hypothetical protein P3M64_08990 [Varunaivibrio sulfuroxidans]
MAANAPRETVGIFTSRDAFESAVAALLKAGFERPDLSVLSSHESLDAAGGQETSWRDALGALVGEIKYEGPLVASGAIVLAGGPVAATLAGIIAAATAGVAASQLLGEVTASPHTDDFARAVDAGSIVLWVRATTVAQENKASEILVENGAQNVHVHTPES